MTGAPDLDAVSEIRPWQHAQDIWIMAIGGVQAVFTVILVVVGIVQLARCWT